jgi:N-formylglutamate deformylase
MDDSMPAGFDVSGDCDGRWPLLLASPHSGRHYPDAFLATSRLTLAQLRRAEDAYVDALLDGVAGVPVLRARYGRAYLDLNRAADELDPGMFDGALPTPCQITDRVASGLGVLPRVAAQGLEIYRRRLPAADAAARIDRLHRPWHDRIATELQRAVQRHGYAILLDCHSMPQPLGIRPPQIVIGDRHGQSAAPQLVALIERQLAASGWRIARNHPYAGGHTTEFHGQPLSGIHAVQIEIDRTLYMDPQKLVCHSGFGPVSAQLTALVRTILTAAPHLGLAPPLAEAAE